VARRYPEAFGALLLQSGSFVFTDIGLITARAPRSTPW
jgi:enterochelin esterase-like enzyme